MWGVTLWCAATWLRWTILFTLTVLAGWWWLGSAHGGFVLLCLVAAIAELYVTRALLREWHDEARLSWWWSP
jgi:hypothetical protein